MLIDSVKKSQLVALVLFWGLCFNAESQTYSNGINTSAWRASSSVFSCQLIHDVPYYGEVVFRTRAGEASGFYLKAKTSRFKAGKVKIVESTPVWFNDPKARELATVGIKQGTRPLWLGKHVTERMLASLNSGMNVDVNGTAWHSEPPPETALKMSAIGFKEEYDRYLGCLSSLIPSNFDQLKRTSLLFPVGPTDELPRSAARKLDHILTLVKHDEKVRVFYIDGHASSVGDRDDNLELSKSRVEQVTAYLKRRGIPDDWITMRWHGERYPAASNGSYAGRAKNRRVTVRLERIEEIEVLPLAAK